MYFYFLPLSLTNIINFRLIETDYQQHSAHYHHSFDIFSLFFVCCCCWYCLPQRLKSQPNWPVFHITFMFNPITVSLQCLGFPLDLLVEYFGFPNTPSFKAFDFINFFLLEISDMFQLHNDTYQFPLISFISFTYSLHFGMNLQHDKNSNSVSNRTIHFTKGRTAHERHTRFHSTYITDNIHICIAPFSSENCVDSIQFSIGGWTPHRNVAPKSSTHTTIISPASWTTLFGWTGTKEGEYLCARAVFAKSWQARHWFGWWRENLWVD